jgi:hypothetical protein
MPNYDDLSYQRCNAKPEHKTPCICHTILHFTTRYQNRYHILPNYTIPTIYTPYHNCHAMCNILHPLVQPRSQALPWKRDCPLSGQCAHHVISYIIQYFPQTATYTYGTVMLLYRHWCSFCCPCWWTWKEDTKFNACILKAHSHSKSGGSIWASVECQCCFWIARGLVSLPSCVTTDPLAIQKQHWHSREARIEPTLFECREPPLCEWAFRIQA